MIKMLTNSTPRQDGLRMPAEYEQHEGCIIVWPQRPGSWSFGADAACEAFTSVIKAIAASEKVYVACAKKSKHWQRASEMLSGLANVELMDIPTDDSWARDIGPTFVVRDGVEGREVRGINWRFNAWGGDVDGLYPDYEQDDAFAAAFAEAKGYTLYEAAPFVLEGGSIHVDGEGTAMVTASCLLSAGRNPELTQAQIEDKLKEYLNVDKVLWLPRGIYNDETNEHVDNVCAFIRPGEVVLAWTDNENDQQYALSKASLDYLEHEADAKGRKIVVHKLPIPDVPVCITEDEVAGFDFVEGEDMREAGERLAASYVNFYFSNDSVVLPAFGGENAASDARAAAILAALCPERKIVQISARAILTGGGNIHCITQQIPKGGRL
ncbi:MAG: agmatine deiminase [Phascolarctobacterium sp.]